MSFPSRESSFLDCTNARYSGPQCSQLLYTAGATGETPTDDPTEQRCERRDEATQDPYAYYKAFLNSAVPSDSGRTTKFIPSHNHSDTHKDITPVIDQGLDDHQPLHARPRTTPYCLAVRLANRSEGTPLATIVEKVSVSTLNSQGSSLGVARFRSILAVKNTSPARGRATGRSPYEPAGIEEEERQDSQIRPSTERESERRRSRSDPLHKVDLSAQPDLPQLPEFENHNLEYTSLSCFLRAILKNFLGDSRSQLHDSSSTAETIATVGPFEQRPNPGHFTPRVEQQSYEVQKYSRKQNTVPVPATTECSDFNTSQCSPVENHATSRSFVVAVEPSLDICAPNLQIPPLNDQKAFDFSHSSHSSALPEHLRHRKVEAASTARPVLASPRDITSDHVLHGVSTPPQCKCIMETCSILEVQKHHQCTNEGVPFYRLEMPSMLEIDQASSAKPNCSVGSVLSTSYSGSVLGVDLDLLNSCDDCSERRSATPVWFTPIEKNIATNSHSATSYLQDQTESAAKPVQKNSSPSRSIQSSALSALLPIALAKGIVQPNNKEPQLSFLSPTGSLIHTEDLIYSKSEKCPRLPQNVTNLPSSRNLHCSKTSTSTSSYDGKQTINSYDALSSVIGLAPNRPTIVPMTTLPKLIAPLPHSLRQHHPEQSHIMMEEDEEYVSLFSILLSEPTTKGCCGAVQRGALKMQKSTTSPVESRDESILSMKIRKMIRSGFKPSKPFSPLSSRKRRTLKKRSRNGPDGRHVPCSHSPSNKERGVPGDIGQIVGHVMRVLFCQPLDGAGANVHAGDGCGSFGDQCKKQIDGNEGAREARDSATPNVRVVNSEKDIE